MIKRSLIRSSFTSTPTARLPSSKKWFKSNVNIAPNSVLIGISFGLQTVSQNLHDPTNKCIYHGQIFYMKKASIFETEMALNSLDKTHTNPVQMKH